MSGAFHTARFVNQNPCPGPDHGVTPCSKGNIIGDRGKFAERCGECFEIRRRRAASVSQSQRNKRLTGANKTKRDGKRKAMCGEPPRNPVKRCRVCLGTPHLCEPGREDEYGRSICKPGTSECRECGLQYIPLPPVHASSTIGSSAWTAVKASTW
jgi:hypothetical protein